MAPIKHAQRDYQNWLYLTPSGYGMARLSVSNDTLPKLHAPVWHDETDPLQQADTLADWVADHSHGTMNLLLGEGYYQMLLVDVPDVPADEIESALRLKAAELLHYDIEEASLEVILLPAEAYHGRTRMAFVVATHKDPLRKWALALAQRGLTLSQIDIDQLQLRNLALRASDLQQTGLLHLRADHCQLLLIYQGELVLSRRFDVGYEDLGADTLGDALVLEGQTDIQRDSLVLELQRSFDYYESQLGLGSINQLNLTGWPGTLGMIENLGHRLGLRFEILRLEDYLQLGEHTLAEPLLPVLGTAFREVQS